MQLLAAARVRPRSPLEQLLRDGGASTLVATLPVALIEVGGDGAVLRCNQAAEALLGRPAEDVVGQPLAASEPELAACLALGDETAGVRITRGAPVGASRITVSARRIADPDADGSLLLVLEAAAGQGAGDDAAAFQAHLLEELPVAVVASDAEGRITHWNAFAEELMGWPAPVALGRDLWRALAANCDSRLSDAVRDGARFRGEVEVQRLGREPVPVDVRVLPLLAEDGGRAGTLLVATDLREQRDALAALAESNARIELILDRVTDAFFALDADSRFTHVNAEAAKLLRGRGEELVGLHLADVLVDASRSVLESEFRRAAREGVPVFFEEFYPSLDSWFSVHAYPSSEGLSVFFQDVTERRRAEEEIIHLAYNDGLTGLPNRTRFREELDLAISRARATGEALAVLYVDLDDFKLVNDSLGHDVGDELLQRLASRMRRVCREEDLLARQGGDEFLVLVADVDAEQAGDVALELAARLERALGEPFVLRSLELVASASIGISLYPQDATDADGLLRHADAAMYAAKRSGRGCARVYEAQDQDPLAQLSLVGRLRKAVDRDQFVLHWQPIADLASGRITGAEALIRWHDAERGLLLPGDFIPLAEDTGLIERVGDWVIEEFCRQSAEWQHQGFTLNTSFNLSLRQLWQSKIADRLLQAFRAARLDPQRIVLEVTESAAMTDADRALRIFRELRAGGVRLALDDFGTGYSSLGRLAALPVDTVKIDRSFVQSALREPSAATLVELLLQLAASLDLQAVAEGIETEGQLRFLLERGCARGQGFYLGRPVPAAELAGRLHAAGCAA